MSTQHPICGPRSRRGRRPEAFAPTSADRGIASEGASIRSAISIVSSAGRWVDYASVVWLSAGVGRLTLRQLSASIDQEKVRPRRDWPGAEQDAYGYCTTGDVRC